MVSIIVPVYQERNLNQFLKQFENLKGEFEIIIVSGDKQNYDTLSFELFRCKKGRAAQMNYGVKHAKFDIIWFLHADSKIEKNSILKIENFLKTNLLGAFKIKFDNDKFLMKICAFMSNLRLKLGGIAFGDQGMFMKKEIFYTLGGFREIEIMEDYDFSLRAKKKWFKFTNTNGTIITSSRRFVSNGIIKTMIKMRLCRLMFKLGVKQEKIIRFYNANS